jgi:hypothetical protein
MCRAIRNCKAYATAIRALAETGDSPIAGAPPWRPRLSSHPSRERLSRCFMRLERRLGTGLWTLLLLYLLTDQAQRPVIWRYSTSDITMIGGCAAGFVIFHWSYRWKLPGGILKLRTAAVSLGFAMVVAFLAVEWFLAATDPLASFETVPHHGYVADPDLGHGYASNHEQDIVTAEWRTRWRSNSIGIRADREYGPKPQGTFRILGVGDSFTVGDQVPLEQTWPGILQARLDGWAGPGRYEVLNCGCAGYGTIHERIWIGKHARRLEADVVILAMTPNDLRENGTPHLFTAQKGFLASAGESANHRRWREERQRWYCLPGVVQHSRVMAAVRSMGWFQRLRLGSAFAHAEAFRMQQGVTSKALYERAETLLLEARDAARSAGAHFALLVFPFKEQLGPLEPGLSPSVFGERWLQFAGRSDIPAADLLPRFRSHPESNPLFWRHDRHCTAEGYRLIGEVAFDLIHGARLISDSGGKN